MTKNMVQNLPCSAVHSFKASNVRVGSWFKDEADLIEVAMMLLYGWELSQGVTIATTLTGDDPVKQSIADRTETRDKLASVEEPIIFKMENRKVEILPADHCEAWDALYTKDGKILPARFERITCHRRSQAWPLTQALRKRCGMDVLTSMPVEVREGLSDLERYTVCLFENMAKLKGSRALSNADQLHAARLFFWSGGNENGLRTSGFSAGTAQKLFGLCRLDKKFPELNIIDGLISGKYDYTRIDKEEARKGGQIPIDVERAKEIIMPGERERAAKIASKVDMVALAEQTPVDVVGYVIDAILANDLGRCSAFIGHREKFNNLMKECGIARIRPEPEA